MWCTGLSSNMSKSQANTDYATAYRALRGRSITDLLDGSSLDPIEVGSAVIEIPENGERQRQNDAIRRHAKFHVAPLEIKGVSPIAVFRDGGEGSTGLNAAGRQNAGDSAR